jgi:hypothetical protein
MTDVELLEKMIARQRSKGCDRWFSLMVSGSEGGMEDAARVMGCHAVSVADEGIPEKSGVFHSIPEPDKIRAA